MASFTLAIAAATGCGENTYDVTPMGEPLVGTLLTLQDSVTGERSGNLHLEFLPPPLSASSDDPCPVLNADMGFAPRLVEGPIGGGEFGPAGTLPARGCRSLDFDDGFYFDGEIVDGETVDGTFSIVGPDIEAHYTGVNLFGPRELSLLDEPVVEAGGALRLRHEPTTDVLLLDGAALPDTEAWTNSPWNWTAVRYEPTTATAVRVHPVTGKETLEYATLVPRLVDGILQLTLPADMAAGFWDIRTTYAYLVPARSCVGFSSCQLVGVNEHTTTIEVR